MTQLLGREAPHFHASAVVKGEIMNDFSLKKFRGSYIVFFFYPLDFTFVCPTELHAFQERRAEFQKRGCEVIACSIDSCHTHLAWLRTPKAQGGIEGIEYPLISDINKSIATSYQVLKEDDGIAYRAQFLIDREGVIRHLLINDLPLGRSVDDLLRTLDALQFVEKHGEVCPANWRAGESGMKPTQHGVKSYFNARADR